MGHPVHYSDWNMIKIKIVSYHTNLFSENFLENLYLVEWYCFSYISILDLSQFLWDDAQLDHLKTLSLNWTWTWTQGLSIDFDFGLGLRVYQKTKVVKGNSNTRMLRSMEPLTPNYWILWSQWHQNIEIFWTINDKILKYRELYWNQWSY